MTFLLNKIIYKKYNEIIFRWEWIPKFIKNLTVEKTVSGGSVANSIVGISQLGDKAGFIGKISDDEFGSNYEDGLKKENVEYFYYKKREITNWHMFNIGNARLRKNNVYFFRNSRKINEKDISNDVIKKVR